MSLNTSLKGRLRNTNLPKSHALFPLYEAVVNSIHSIDERIKNDQEFEISKAYIKVKIIRSIQQSLDNSKSDITGFKIVDNGIGFNKNNYKSFQTLDSEYKIEQGCRGVGRLLWLKAFEKVLVSSSFEEDSGVKVRNFDFNIINDIHNENENISTNNKIETSVILQQINENYVKYLPKTTKTIANALLEHCLWYYLREGGAPRIEIEDEEEPIFLDEEYDSYMLNAADTDTFTINSRDFDITHVKLKSTSHSKHSVIYSAANRVVKEESLKGKISGLFGVLKDGDDEFCYMCYITSEYLTEKVNSERMDFNISESIDGLLDDEEILFKEIRDKVLQMISDYLEPYLTENKRVGKKKVIDFIAKKAPRYRPIIDRISDDEKIVDPNISDKDLELKLHKLLMVVEQELLTEGHDLMKPTIVENEEDYSKRIEDYLSKASDIKKSDLANYVTHRKVILDLLSKAIDIQNDGKYSKEDVIHKLIMPMQKNSNELFSDDSNLWLIDERLTFHNFLASDKTIRSMNITDADQTKEPDILSLNVYDNPLLINEGQSLPLASITVVEIKRPMRNDAKQGEDKDPIEQALGYLNRVRKGGVKTELGRPIPDSTNIPGFCYVLCDITSSIINRCDILDLQVTADKLGYFGYHKKFNAYIEVLSFNRLLNSAKERNRAFFDKLGLPVT